MKIMLIHSSLHFVSTGTAKAHAVDTTHAGAYGQDPQRYTMCGRVLTSGTQELATRKLDPSQVCRRCIASLRTYTGRMGTTPHVRFEQEAEV